jgi:hypothetical protein
LAVPIERVGECDVLKVREAAQAGAGLLVYPTTPFMAALGG